MKFTPPPQNLKGSEFHIWPLYGLWGEYKEVLLHNEPVSLPFIVFWLSYEHGGEFTDVFERSPRIDRAMQGALKVRRKKNNVSFPWNNAWIEV